MEFAKELAQAIETNYEIRPADIKAIRGQYYFTHDNKPIVAKKVTISNEKWHCVDKMKKHLFKNGFKDIDMYVQPKSGEGVFEIMGEQWTLLYLPTLSECNFEGLEQLEKICRTVAKMHAAAEGFDTKNTPKMKNELGELPYMFSKRLSELKKTRIKAEKSKSEFDILYLKDCNYFIEMGERALEIVNSQNYIKAIELAESKNYFCHLDLTFQNILTNEDTVFIVNFETAGLETKVYDVANLIRRKMRKCDWDADVAHHMFYNYANINAITKEEAQVLKAMLMFPQKYWRVINKYYNMNRSWAKKNMCYKLEEASNEREAHSAFVKRFLSDY